MITIKEIKYNIINPSNKKYLRNTILKNKEFEWVTSDHYAWKGTLNQYFNLIDKYEELEEFKLIKVMPKLSMIKSNHK